MTTKMGLTIRSTGDCGFNEHSITANFECFCWQPLQHPKLCVRRWLNRPIYMCPWKILSQFGQGIFASIIGSFVPLVDLASLFCSAQDVRLLSCIFETLKMELGTYATVVCQGHSVSRSHSLYQILSTKLWANLWHPFSGHCGRASQSDVPRKRVVWAVAEPLWEYMLK